MRLDILAFILFCLWLFSPDKEIFGVACVLMLFLAKKGWREDEPKVILFGMIFYWLTVCTLMIYGIFFHKHLVDLTETPDTFVYTTYLALFATFVYGSGILLAIRKVKVTHANVLFKELQSYSARKLLIAYCCYSAVSSVLGGVVLSFGGLSQFGVAVIWMKWAFLTLLIIHTLLFPSNQKYVYIVLVVEVLLSFSGFWSSFKDYLFIAAASFLTFSTTINLRKVLFVSVLGVVAFFLMVVWSVVKGEYRQYLTGGQKTQVIAEQGTFDNLQKLTDLVGEKFSKENFKENFSQGLISLAYRVNYTEYFAMSVAQVPKALPFEGGALLMAGFEHVFKPRIFFPNKKSIDDSELTSKYTGRRFSGADQGVSFSLGLVAERYIDYGPIYMFVPIFFFGYLLGIIYKFILSRSFNHVWGLALTAPLFFLIPSLGVATTKFLGWLLTYFIAWFIINKFLLKRVDSFLKHKNDD